MRLIIGHGHVRAIAEPDSPAMNFEGVFPIGIMLVLLCLDAQSCRGLVCGLLLGRGERVLTARPLVYAVLELLSGPLIVGVCVLV